MLKPSGSSDAEPLSATCLPVPAYCAVQEATGARFWLRRKTSDLRSVAVGAAPGFQSTTRLARIAVMSSTGAGPGVNVNTDTGVACAVFTMSSATTVLLPQLAFGQPAVEHESERIRLLNALGREVVRAGEIAELAREPLHRQAGLVLRLVLKPVHPLVPVEGDERADRGHHDDRDERHRDEQLDQRKAGLVPPQPHGMATGPSGSDSEKFSSTAVT